MTPTGLLMEGDWRGFVLRGTQVKVLPALEPQNTTVTLATSLNDIGDIVGQGFPDGFFAPNAVTKKVQFVTIRYPQAIQTVA